MSAFVHTYWPTRYMFYVFMHLDAHRKCSAKKKAWIFPILHHIQSCDPSAAMISFVPTLQYVHAQVEAKNRLLSSHKPLSFVCQGRVGPGVSICQDIFAWRQCTCSPPPSSQCPSFQNDYSGFCNDERTVLYICTIEVQ